MRKAVQQRTLETRARLIAEAQAMVRAAGHEALRIDELVARAGVAKGTFFAHFEDKDSLMDLLIGTQIDRLIDAAAAKTPPRTVEALSERLAPLLEFAASERYVFDVMLRRSGAAAREEIGPIAATFDRVGHLLGGWLAGGPFRDDVPLQVLAEGVQAFIMQTLALHFCAMHQGVPLKRRLLSYLRPWLGAMRPGAAPAPPPGAGRKRATNA